MRFSTVLAGALLIFATAAHAQYSPEYLAPARAHFGGGLSVAQPVGEFSNYVSESLGFNINFVYRLDPSGVLGIRTEADFVNYGRERFGVMVSPTIGGRIMADLVTNNNIFAAGLGPQVVLPLGPIEPYGYGTVGFSYFATISSLESRYGRDRVIDDVNFSDTVLSLGAGGGIYVPLTHGRVPIALDAGVRFRRSSDVEYLREGDIEDLPGGGIAIYPVRSDADMVVYHFGVSVGLRPSQPRR